MDKDLLASIKDYFEVDDFVNVLGLTLDDIIEAFESDVEEKLPAIKELMGLEDD